jgi:hypothetical protein
MVAEAGGFRAATQAGFRKGSRIEDNVLMLLTTIQRAVKLGTPAFLMFVDLSKAYDTVDRGLLWKTLLEELHLDPHEVMQL